MARRWGFRSSALAGRTSTFCVLLLLSKRRPPRRRRRIPWRRAMNLENETGSFALGDFAVEKGGVIREARLAWPRFRTLNDKRDNLILYPSSYSARLASITWLTGAAGILPTSRWCFIA